MRSATILFDYCREATTVTRAAPLGVHIDRPNDLCVYVHVRGRTYLPTCEVFGLRVRMCVCVCMHSSTMQMCSRGTCAIAFWALAVPLCY